MKKRSRVIYGLILCIIITIFGCGKTATENDSTESTDKNGKEDAAGGIINIDKHKLPFDEEEIYTQLFDINNKIEINIDISEEEIANIQKDYDKYSNMGSKSPIYRQADLYIKIETDTDAYTYLIEDVGIRMKGNTSRRDFYSSEEGIYNLIHFKIDFQETFDDEDYYDNPHDWSDDEEGREERKDRTFALLENLEIKWNKNDDSTYIREYYAYETYRANGVLAPHTNIASVEVAGIHEGVFSIYEPVDKVFIEKHVAEKDQGGDLYKCGWTFIGASLTEDCSIGVEDEDAALFYNYDLKTNKKTSEHEQMINLIKVLNKGDATKEELEEVVDIDNFLSFEAVSYFMGNPDDLRNNYNNHYIYFLKSSGKAIFIPYDMDRCLGVTKSYNPNGNGMTESDPFSTEALGAGEYQRNQLYIYTVSQFGYYIDEFKDTIKRVVSSGWFDVEKFSRLYEIAKGNYADCTTPDKEFKNAKKHKFSFSLDRSAGLGSDKENASFEEYITAKLKWYNYYISK